ncbi:hypothetical protein VHEMI09981 [[Torrubiella] hemipterigena]|uniref:Uncharacterized protein n=1 Tax=[Torrubiella] hemipterigena TaxID=1531966 RepID=A0A0A1TBK0_9HYPO|nr:hypothetical protein VHEMI09981 [[Torrubiella] hemipterigena]
MQLVNIGATLLLLIPETLALPILQDGNPTRLPCPKSRYHTGLFGPLCDSPPDTIIFDHEEEDTAEILPLKIDPKEPVSSQRTNDSRKRLEPIEYYDDQPASGTPPENDSDFPPDDSRLGTLGPDGKPVYQAPPMDFDGPYKTGGTLPCPKTSWPSSFGVGPVCDPKLPPLEDDQLDDPNEPHITLP